MEGIERNNPAEREPKDSDRPFLSDIREIRRRAREHIQAGAVTPSYDANRAVVLKLLNQALATELVCVLRYRRHYFMADGVLGEAIKKEFLTHAEEEQAHADQIAERIVQLGGEPDFNPQSLQGRSHASYDASLDLQAMVRANLVAERIAIETYRQMIVLIGDKDPTTRRMLEEILSDEEEHADELKDWLGH